MIPKNANIAIIIKSNPKNVFMIQKLSIFVFLSLGLTISFIVSETA